MLRNSVLVAALSAIAAIVASGLGSDVYPARGVTLYAVLVVIEAAVLLVVLRPKTYRRSWGRALAATGACVVALILSARNTMGAPEYVYPHQKWLVAVSIAFLALAIGSFVGRLRKRHSA